MAPPMPDTAVPTVAAPTNSALAAEAATVAQDPNALPTIPLIQFQDVPLTVAIENLARQANINYLLDPQVAAKNTNFVAYADGDQPTQFIDKSILDDRTIYPDAATMAKLFTIVAHDQKSQRLINRLWTRIKTGE